MHAKAERAASADEAYMRQAIRLALRARGRTSPNPLVGCVIVRDGRVLATGWHKKAGDDHAEAAALRKLGWRAPRATATSRSSRMDFTGARRRVPIG